MSFLCASPPACFKPWSAVSTRVSVLRTVQDETSRTKMGQVYDLTHLCKAQGRGGDIDQGREQSALPSAVEIPVISSPVLRDEGWSTNLTLLD